MRTMRPKYIHAVRHGTVAFIIIAFIMSYTLLGDAQPFYTTSGAAIGDTSIYLYTSLWTGQQLTLSTTNAQDSLSVFDIAGVPDGIQIYCVEKSPMYLNINTSSEDSMNCGIYQWTAQDRYFGVFLVNGTNPSYTVKYFYTADPKVNLVNEPNLILYNRPTNADTVCPAWTDLTASLETAGDTLTKLNLTGRNEYLLGLKPQFPLPIELLTFNAQWKDERRKDALLHWETASESNSAYFEVQRSADGIHFNTIGQVEAAGYSHITLQYSFIDQEIPYEDETGNNRWFYRLRQVDHDGSFRFSEIRAIMRNRLEILKLWPNPARDHISLLMYNSRESGIELLIINSLGQEVLRRVQVFAAGSHRIDLDVSAYAEGVYMIRAATTTGSYMSQKQLIVQ